MKKTIYLILISLFAFTGICDAQVTAMNVGYCEGNVKTTGTSNFSSSEKDTWISGAIYIPASMLKVYAGNRIEAINAGMASVLNIDVMSVWIRETLDGPDIAQGEISKTTEPKLVKGWNAVYLEEAYNIPEDTKGLYIGYSFHQTGASMGLSVHETPHENALFVKMGSNAEWVDRSNEGMLSVEALIFGENLPKYNLVLENINVQPVFVLNKGNLGVSATLYNAATNTITGFDVVCNIDNCQDVYTIHVDEQIAYKERKTVDVVFNVTGITTDSPKMRQATITIANLKEGNDENESDNSAVADFEVVRHDFTRNVLLEEFTGEGCPNCPRVAGYLDNIFTDTEKNYADRVNVICHHSGYGPDWLTRSSDSEYLWFYNAGGGTYAPATMFDRFVGDFLTSKTSPVICPPSEEYICQVLDTRLSEPAFVSLEIKAEMESEDAGKVKVTVVGERSKEDFSQNPPRISVVLVENGIAARRQAGAGKDYVHNHVPRSENSVWGDILEWNDNSYTYSCELNVAKDCVRNNLSIVAYIWDYNEEDPTKCAVANSAGLAYCDFDVTPASIDKNTIDSSDEPLEYYSCDGIKLSQPCKGLNIVKMENGKVIKIMVK